MQVLHCDFCGQVISDRESIFYFGVLEITNKDKHQPTTKTLDLMDYLHQQSKQQKYLSDKLLRYEICENCKKVFDYLLNTRKKELLKMHKELNKINKKTYHNRKGE